MTNLYSIFIVFLLGASYIDAYLPPIMRFEKIIVSNLETIISSNAISSSVFMNFRKEIDIERAFLQFVPMHMSCTTCYIYLSIVLTVLYGQWRFYSGSQIKIQKLRKIDRYTRVESVIKNIVFLFIIIFMKDIESAS